MKCHPERSSLGPHRRHRRLWGKRSEGPAFACRSNDMTGFNTPAILRNMKYAILPAALALLLTLSACKATPNTDSATPSPSAASEPTHPRVATGSGFDYYLLNLSWSPEFCYSHPNAPECASHPAFVLHGLWPQNSNGGYPENCSNAPGPTDPASFSDIYLDQGLLEHEWHTHGTCSGLGANDFFTTARTAYKSVAIPATLSNLSSQISMPPDEIISLFSRANPLLPRESVAISCGHNFLTAVEVCLDKSLHPIACGPIRSCRANTVRIPPPR
jgi:ribonuclease T2